MKTMKRSSAKSWITPLLLVTIWFMASCGNPSGNNKGLNSTDPDQQAKVNPPSVDLHTATVLGDMNAIRQHIQAGSDLNEREPSMGSTPLISASLFGKAEVAGALIEAGADVNLQNNEGSTALHTAAFMCHTEIVRMLLDHGADKSLQNVYGSTPLASVAGPFSEVKPIYAEFNKKLGPLGLKLDNEYLEETRPVIAGMLR